MVSSFSSHQISLLLSWQWFVVISYPTLSFARKKEEKQGPEGAKSEAQTPQDLEDPFAKSEGLPSTELDPSSSSHKKQWNVLTRVSSGPRATQFPQISALFQGDKASKLQALKLYLEQGENLEQCETAIMVQKRYKDSLNHNRRWMTVKQMKEAGCSEWLGRKKFIEMAVYLCNFYLSPFSLLASPFHGAVYIYISCLLQYLGRISSSKLFNRYVQESNLKS